MRVAFGGMSELFKSCESLFFAGRSSTPGMGLDHLEVESSNVIEEGLHWQQTTQHAQVGNSRTCLMVVVALAISLPQSFLCVSMYC